MNRQRYEAVPQRDEAITLDNIHNYNYNSGVATSVASSTYTPSIIAPSIPSSPPPSFHTHSSPGTPRPSAAQMAGSVSGQSYAELWGVAPSTIGGETMGTVMGEEGLATIASLKQRVEWLEESIGRLLTEKDNEAAKNQNGKSRDNCCVTFTDASPDLERALALGGTNCCVTFRSRKEYTKAERHQHLCIIGLVLIAMSIMVTIIMSSGHDLKVLREPST